MRQTLQSLLNEYKDKYAELIAFVEKHHQTKIWGMGVMPSYSPAPYICELQGCKPGRFLKKPSEPGRDRQCYFLDHNKQIIGEIKYAKYINIKNQWIVYRRFFINKSDCIIELIFGSELEGNLEANLDSVSVTTIKDNRTEVHSSLLNTGEHFETLYKYDFDKITSIVEKIWREIFTERLYEVQHFNEAFTISEILPDNSKLQVYPDN